MKTISVRFKTCSLLVCAVALTLSSTACDLSKKAREEKEMQKADRMAQHSEEKQVQSESKKADKIKPELNEYLRVYNSIAGYYKGEVFGAKNELLGIPENVNPIEIRISVTNLPSPIESDRQERESDVAAKIEKLALNVTINEFYGVPFHCLGENVKPDLNSGEILVKCGDRSFRLGVDSSRNAVGRLDMASVFDMRSRDGVNVICENKADRNEGMNLIINGTMPARLLRVDSPKSHAPSLKWTATE